MKDTTIRTKTISDDDGNYYSCEITFEVWQEEYHGSMLTYFDIVEMKNFLKNNLPIDEKNIPKVILDRFWDSDLSK